MNTRFWDNIGDIRTDYDEIVESFEVLARAHGLAGYEALAHLERAYQSAKNRGTLARICADAAREGARKP